MEINYWQHRARTRLTRKQFLAGAATAAGAIGAATLAGCGDDDDSGAAPTSAPTPSGSGGAATPTAGAGGGAPFKPAGAKRGGVLTVLSPSEPPNLDPHLVITVQVAQTTQVYSRLIHADANVDKLIPELAHSWEQPDQTSYTFKLRQGVKFHSGDELTSEDVKFSLERIGQIGVDKPDPQFAQAFMMSDVASIDTPDKYTIIVKTKQPSAPTLSYLGAPFNGIVNKKFTLANDLKTKMNGTGPFKLREWKRSQEISFERHGEYFWAADGLPYLDGWRMIISPDSGTNNAAFVSGKTVGGFPHTFSGKAKALDGFKKQIADLEFVGRDATWWTYFDMNKRKAPWSDVRVRKAVQLAVDRVEAGDRAHDGEFALQGPVAAGFAAYALPQDEIKKMPGFRTPKDADVAEAKRLLEAAGFGPNNPIKATNITTPLHPWYYGFSLALKDQLAKVGINLEVKEFPDFGSFLQARAKFDFDTYAYSQGGPDDVDQYLTEVFSSTSPSNFGGFKDDKADSLLAQQRRALDRTERKKAVDELQRYLMLEAHPHAFLPTIHGYVWWRKPFHIDKSLITPAYTAFFGQFTWLDPVPGNMKDFNSF